MNKKQLFKEIGLIDNDLIEEAIAMINIKERNRHWTRWIARAAAIVFVIGIGAVINLIQREKVNEAVPKDVVESNVIAEKHNNEDTNSNDSDFKGFALTAYTMDKNSDLYLTANYKSETLATIMEPDVKILLAQYSPLMSSVPGLPFTFEIADESMDIDGISVRVDSGKLIKWDPQIGNGSVTDCKTECTCNEGETLYWSPLSEEDNSIVTNATITVSAIKEGKEIGCQKISVIFDGENYYAVVGEFECT